MSKLEVGNDNFINFYNKRYEDSYMEAHGDLNKVTSLFYKIPIAVKNILDYGCGQGAWINTLSKQFPESKIYGIDISDKAIEKASRKHAWATLLTFDGKKTPFPDNFFDLIFSYHVLEHVQNIEETILEICRLLKKGGYVYIIFPCGNKGSFEEKVARIIKGGKEISIDGKERFFYEDSGHIRRMKSEDVITLFASHNISVVETFFANQFWGAIQWIVNSEIDFINDFFDYRRACNFATKITLLFYNIFFHILKFDYSKNIKLDNNIFRKVERCLKWIFQNIFVNLLRKIISIMALLEWNYYKAYPSGSEQYLIFTK